MRGQPLHLLVRGPRKRDQQLQAAELNDLDLSCRLNSLVRKFLGHLR